MKVWKNTSTLDGYDNGLIFTEDKEQADCITLRIPKTFDDEAFMNSDRLAMMKNDAILINTARGSIVDEGALYNEVKSGRLKAAFDVFWKEPYDGKLIEFYPDKFYMSPHVASTCSRFLKGCRKGLDLLIQELDHG